jgi:hypothetical protein
MCSGRTPIPMTRAGMPCRPEPSRAAATNGGWALVLDSTALTRRFWMALDVLAQVHGAPARAQVIDRQVPARRGSARMFAVATASCREIDADRRPATSHGQRRRCRQARPVPLRQAIERHREQLRHPSFSVR